MVEIVEDTSDSREKDEGLKIENGEITLKEVVDEVCPNVDYGTKPEVVKSHYLRHFEIVTII